MRSTGIVRRLDELGRVVLPMELRKTLKLVDRDPLEIFINDDMVILKKYCPSCIFSGSMDNLIEYKGHKVSGDVLEELAKAFGYKVEKAEK